MRMTVSTALFSLAHLVNCGSEVNKSLLIAAEWKQFNRCQWLGSHINLQVQINLEILLIDFASDIVFIPIGYGHIY